MLIGRRSRSRRGSGVARRSGRGAGQRLRHGHRLAADRAAFDALSEEWLELDATAEGADALPVLRLVPRRLRPSRTHGHAFEPLIVTLREHGRLVGLLPLQRRAHPA